MIRKNISHKSTPSNFTLRVFYSFDTTQLVHPVQLMIQWVHRLQAQYTRICYHRPPRAVLQSCIHVLRRVFCQQRGENPPEISSITPPFTVQWSLESIPVRTTPHSDETYLDQWRWQRDWLGPVCGQPCVLTHRWLGWRPASSLPVHSNLPGLQLSRSRYSASQALSPVTCCFSIPANFYHFERTCTHSRDHYC